MSSESADVGRMFERILRELAEIRQVIEPKHCTPADLKLLAKLLPAIHDYLGKSAFTTWEVLIDPGIAELAPNANALGNLLSRAAHDGIEVSGYSVLAGGRNHNARLWRVAPGLGDEHRKRS